MTPPPATAGIRDTDLADALGERYLSYALSTIMARSLPDVRDGLKPVHRRLLYAMLQLGLDPASGYKKAARVVGDVIGKFHPHGDIAVYEALVRLAQDFAVRYPLVDGQGNFGNIDGDNAAAMRYTEARLTAVAAEPVVLPAAFPNLLANGATGIAVGMATSIPPHNAGELCDALLHLIQTPKASVAELLGFVKGPDFPTGGVLVEPIDALRVAYETGRGSFRVRARWTSEKLKGGTFQVVVTEIPYQVPKARLIERIAELMAEKKLALLADIRDESTDDVRIVLEPKSRNVDDAVLMESLFRQTELEARIALNMNVLDAGAVPRVMDLKQVLRAFLDHRQVVLQRTSRHRLGEIVRRLEVLQGYLIVYLNIDAVIKIIRNEDEPKPALIKRFKLSDVQADAILNMRLRSLRKLEEIEIKREVDALTEQGDALRKLLDSEKRRWKTIAAEIAEMRQKFGQDTKLGRRRTLISVPPVALVMPVEAYVEKEAVTVLCSEKGWVRALRGHDVDAEEIKYKEGDGARFVLQADSTDRLLLFATDGRFYTLAAGKLPRGRGFGEPLRLAIDLANDHDVVAMFVYRPGAKLLVASDDGRGFVVAADDAVAQTRAGKQVLTPAEGARAHRCAEVKGGHVAVIGDNRKLLIFPLAELPEMARGRGVTLQKYHDGGLSDVTTFNLADGLTFAAGERTRTMTEDLAVWLGKRAQAGRMPPHGVGRDKRFS
ncbi:MAG: DNA topoisomerase IV subunit A [Proteobacteria bacterium]|nr:DNA topoisomerase IV subunit A [Pseudomonadota bacterium]